MGSNASNARREVAGQNQGAAQRVFVIQGGRYQSQGIQPYNYNVQGGGGGYAQRQVPPAQVQPTCVVKNPVNLRKQTLHLERDPREAHLYWLNFEMDAATEVEISVYLIAKEQIDANGLPLIEGVAGQVSGGDPVFQQVFPKGLKQTFRERLINLLQVPFEDMYFKPLHPDRFPLVIVLRARVDQPRDKPPVPAQAQFTYAEFVRGAASGAAGGGGSSASSSSASASASAAAPAGGPGGSGGGAQVERDTGGRERQHSIGSSVYSLRVLKQKVQYGMKTYEMQEIYGIRFEKHGTEPADDLTTGRECVICLSEDKNTMVLPCRHMCLCSGCANIMRMQSNKCPICRQSVSSLLQICITDEQLQQAQA
uniref:RING-type E3 ubiquitin transferase n=1 Tax=Chromera velia CCMP2878 TaxID=1169474 RepID=A0A0G4G0K6_9ALVE|eukprot:Cvel_19606.t1-p1 / transcript=Cvel_19606.t1 / gene=Cvel_19606 / organism=Chromera_velia_CCMP2878 / gene_product=Probable E3 ubiquitin-protein ligase LOG2, putative / transcript_product=Probable E3 ubiquitin-protein ligase LOG2, putative / location=Cvel_scaffold1704:24536-30796(+) / protein_length=366 / sequence_SO=supercontig / SO=protein_coding / is_pseudo=false